MADRTHLGRIGYLLGAITLAVMMIGGAVITNHLSAANAQDAAISATEQAR
ncbi:MAG: hypothetical protein JOZ70_01865 [Pseudolabrys sp.]|nr:hypothetical protein [Pseudolabrys sp.]MBV9953972.1 hypothetical protein [Pseudolabrys sp.]